MFYLHTNYYTLLGRKLQNLRSLTLTTALAVLFQVIFIQIVRAYKKREVLLANPSQPINQTATPPTMIRRQCQSSGRELIPGARTIPLFRDRESERVRKRRLQEPICSIIYLLNTKKDIQHIHAPIATTETTPSKVAWNCEVGADAGRGGAAATDRLTSCGHRFGQCCCDCC